MNWWSVGLLGGLVGLDATSFPQFMFSRPLVAGTLAGLLFGQPAEGMLIGALIEIFDLGILPVGAARYPDAGTATVVAVAAYASAPLSALDPGLLLLAVMLGLVWEVVTGTSTVLLRRINERLVLATPRWTGRPGRALERLHLTSVALDFARAAALAVVGTALGAALMERAAGHWLLGSETATSVLTIATAAVFGGLITIFGGWHDRRRSLLAGLACGSLLLLLW